MEVAVYPFCLNKDEAASNITSLLEPFLAGIILAI
jgi:hypothetical protein